MARFVTLSVLLLLVAACGSAQDPTGSAPGSSIGTATSSTSGSPGPDGSAGPADSPEPTATATPTDTAGPTASPTSGPTDGPSGSPGSSGSPGIAAGCTGTAKNQAFYASAAGKVSWAVYCPVLPAGWHVEAGQYGTAKGGTLEIDYKGPDGAHLKLQEGAICNGGACAPDGSDLGAATFGDQEGTLIAAADGTFVVVVLGAGNVGWLATGTALDETTMRTFADDLIVVGD